MSSKSVPVNRELAKQYVELRESRGLSQLEFWERIGVRPTTGCRYESGERGIPERVQIAIGMMYKNNFTNEAHLRYGKEGFMILDFLYNHPEAMDYIIFRMQQAGDRNASTVEKKAKALAEERKAQQS